MSDFLQSVLRQSVEEVLEKMFFIRSLGDTAPEPPENELAVHLRFDGEPSGSFLLRITRDAARSISADFLGAEEGELTPQQVGEVICELANMICGSVLSRVESAATFRLSPPQFSDTEAPLGEAAELPGQSATHFVEAGGGILTVAMKTESPVCSTAEKRAF
ncbi:CheC, inhibitor of MCP methylation [Candidatus Sulfopaludibacter sp. SbA3]|nr:CheC, inhibitor of MCP methylation [Candidatus Sulfopaludibacter sp. SbA3]